MWKEIKKKRNSGENNERRREKKLNLRRYQIRKEKGEGEIKEKN